MIIAAAQNDYSLPETVPTAVIAAVMVLAVAGWVALHVLKRRLATIELRVLLFLARVIVGFVAVAAAMQVAVRGIVLKAGWWVWPISLLASAAVEILIAFYTLERRTVSRRAGLTLAALRVVLVMLVIAMLAQPVLSWQRTEEIQRYVAVLVDESASMRVADPQRSPAERLRLAETLSVRGARRPWHFEPIGKALRSMRQELAAVSDELGLLASAEPASRQRRLESRRRGLHQTFSDAGQTIGKQLDRFARNVEAVRGELRLDDATQRQLVDVKAELTVGVRDRLAQATRITHSDAESRLAGQYDPLVQAVRGASTALAKLVPRIESLARTLDGKLHAALPEPRRKQIDAIARRSRLELARHVLLHRPVTDFGNNKTAPSLLERLEEGYKVRLYTFAADCAEVDSSEWRAAGSGSPSTAPTTAAAVARPQRERRTDLAGAIEKAMTEMSGKQLAGIVMLADGRHNAARRVEPLAAQLGSQRVPVCSIVMGPETPPRDAAVIAVHAPETVCERDKLYVSAELKLDGLADQSVSVALYDDKRQVEQKTVKVPKVDSYRTAVQFSDEPKTAGLHAYRVGIKALDEEVFEANNEYPLTVSVTKERTKLLLIEGRPRWEFRYVKNLFADRDRTVKLQYVLLQPDQIASWKNRLKVHASASRQRAAVEATLLPASPQEWMKFDVIVLGDVPRAMLKDEQVETLGKFVTERGGTLIVIAGGSHMPHAYDKTALQKILPMTFEAATGAVSGSRRAGFRIALTAEGRHSVVMRQKVDPEKNLAVWNAVPEVYWRHPTAAATEAATVLAYALPPSPPEFLRPLPPEKADDEELIRQREAQRRDFERANALIAVHNVAAGRVMMLSFDRTWRLRYRIGDTHHHKFWGQVLRWATASKLPAGTDYVKLGTDRTRYAPDTPVRVRARIIQRDLTPVNKSKTVSVKVFRDDKPVLRKRLEWVEGSAGMYFADLGTLTSGTYRVELVSPDAEPILAADKKKKVVTEFSVDPVSGPELVELAADRGLLARLAGFSGGTVLEPHQAAEVLDSLGPRSLVRREEERVDLWDHWGLLVLIVLVATCEWILRKRVGLA